MTGGISGVEVYFGVRLQDPQAGRRILRPPVLTKSGVGSASETNPVSTVSHSVGRGRGVPPPAPIVGPEVRVPRVDVTPTTTLDLLRPLCAPGPKGPDRPT